MTFNQGREWKADSFLFLNILNYVGRFYCRLMSTSDDGTNFVSGDFLIMGLMEKIGVGLKRRFFLVMLLLSLPVLSQQDSISPADQKPTQVDLARSQVFWLDTATDPENDFHRYALGGFLDKHPAPEDWKGGGIGASLFCLL